MSTTANDREHGKWFKSSFSGNPSGECVEACPQPEAVHLRDSKRKDEPGHDVIRVSTTAFSAFITHLRS